MVDNKYQNYVNKDRFLLNFPCVDGFVVDSPYGDILLRFDLLLPGCVI